MELKSYPKSNGTLDISKDWSWGWPTFHITGGPYANYSPKHVPDAFGVCLQAEARNPVCNVWLPIQDYSVPTDKAALTLALEQTIDAMLEGQNVYVGCMGGMGRTGLFLAVLAKALGAEDPVAMVRAQYYHHAVETDEQKKFVEGFDTKNLTRYARRAASRAFFNGKWRAIQHKWLGV